MHNDTQTTCDAFLDGALSVLQPKTGYRAATDPVFLAASIPAKPGHSILELGCGVGVALLCLGHRVSGLNITGLEIQNDYAELAKHNLQMNKITGNIVSGDLMNMPRELVDRSYDHIMFNPPFYDSSDVSPPKDLGKSLAHVMNINIRDWISVGLKRLKPKGRLTFIHRSDILPYALEHLKESAGDIKVKPLMSRLNQPAKRVIVTCRKGTNGPFELLSPLVIHKGAAHAKDAGAYSELANNVLRKASALKI